MTIHLVEYASQPDIQIKCTGDWDTPKWGTMMKLPDGVHLSEKLEFYTFDKSNVTCDKCKIK